MSAPLEILISVSCPHHPTPALPQWLRNPIGSLQGFKQRRHRTRWGRLQYDFIILGSNLQHGSKIVYEPWRLHLSTILIFYFRGDYSQAYHVCRTTLGPKMFCFTRCWNKPLSFWANTLGESETLLSAASADSPAFNGQAALLAERPWLRCHLMANFVSKKQLLRNPGNESSSEMRPSAGMSQTGWECDIYSSL